MNSQRLRKGVSKWRWSHAGLRFEQAGSRLLKAALLSQRGICDASDQLSHSRLLPLAPHPFDLKRKAKITQSRDQTTHPLFLQPRGKFSVRECARQNSLKPHPTCSGCLPVQRQDNIRIFTFHIKPYVWII